MGLLVEYRVLDNVKVINEGTDANKKMKIRGKFQKCDEVNNNGRVYPRKVLESQITAIQDKVSERSLVGALDHPPNDAIHLSQASHLITKIWVEKNGDVMGEAEILSTPSGKIVEALLKDNVKIGISSRGLGTVSESKTGKVVNEDYRLITFDLVSDPSTKGAYGEITESVKLNSQKARKIVDKVKSEQIFLTLLSQKLDERMDEGLTKKINKNVKKYKEYQAGGAEDGPKGYEKSVRRSRTLNSSALTSNLRIKRHKNSRGVKTKGKFTENSTYQRLAKLIVEGSLGMKRLQRLSKASRKAAQAQKFDFDKAQASSERSSKAYHKRGIKNYAKRAMAANEQTKLNEAVSRLNEGKASNNDKLAIKSFLISRLGDIQWSYPLEKYDPDKKPDTDEVRTNKKIKSLKRILDIIDSI